MRVWWKGTFLEDFEWLIEDEACMEIGNDSEFARKKGGVIVASGDRLADFRDGSEDSNTKNERLNGDKSIVPNDFYGLGLGVR